VFVPLMAPALFLMGSARSRAGKRTSLPELAVLLRWALGVSLALASRCRSPSALGALVGFGLALAALGCIECFPCGGKKAGTLARPSRHGSGASGRRRVRRRRDPGEGYEAEKDLKMKPAIRSSSPAILPPRGGVGGDGPNYAPRAPGSR